MKNNIIKFSIFFFTFLALSFLLISCEPKEPTIYTIKGKLLYDCAGDTVVNTDISIANKTNLIGSSLTGINTKTDNNGDFAIQYKRNGGSSIKLMVAGNIIIEEIPNNKNIDLGIIYYHSSCNFVQKIMVENAYTMSDTLYITNYYFNSPSPHSTLHVIPGPFRDTILPNVYGWSQLAEKSYYHLNKVGIGAGYEIWNGPFGTYEKYRVSSGISEGDDLIDECNVLDTVVYIIK